MSSLACCNVPLELGCYGHCGVLYFNIRAQQTGIHYLEFIRGNMRWCVEFSALAGDFIKVDNRLPEFGQIIFSIKQPDKTKLVYNYFNRTKLTKSKHDTFIIEVMPKIIVESEKINIESMLCVNECPKFDDINLNC